MQPTKNIRFTFLILILMASLSACTSGSSNSSGAPAGGPQGTDGTNPGIPSTDANGNSTGQPTRPARPTTCTLPQPPAQNMNDFVVMAIHFADTACLKVAVNSGFNVNTKVKDLGESKARYPLLRALDASDLAFAGLNGNKTDVVEFLISNGADPAVLNDLGQNALQILFDASSGKLAENLDVLNLFIDLKKFDLNEKGPQRDTYLVRAINEKLLDLAKRLIANGADINLSTGSTTPLFAAIDNRLTPLAEFIIDQGADLSLTDFASQTALTIAIRANQENLAIKIANKMTAAQLNKLDMIQKSSVIWAIQAHMVKLVPTLIVNGADVNLSPTDTNCLIESVRSRNSIIYNAVVRQMKNLNSAGENGETALMFAATFGDASTVSDLIKRGAKIEIHDQTGNSALTMASTADATEALVVSGANVNLLTSSGESALSIAISRGRIDQARVLLTHGADILWRDHSGNGLLFKNDSVSALDLLVTEYHLDINANNQDGESILASAVQDALISGGPDRLSEVLRLLDHKANPNMTDRHGEPLLLDIVKFSKDGPWVLRPDLTMPNDQSDLLRLFILAGVDVNIANTDGDTALHLVDTVEEAKLILQAGANITIKNKRGMSISDRQYIMVEILKSDIRLATQDLADANKELLDLKAQSAPAAQISAAQQKVAGIQNDIARYNQILKIRTAVKALL